MHRPTDRNVTSVGLRAAEHPLLDAAVDLADDGLVLTGRLAPAAHEWLTGYTVLGRPLLPGTTYVDLALHAADLVCCTGSICPGTRYLYRRTNSSSRPVSCSRAVVCHWVAS